MAIGHGTLADDIETARARDTHSLGPDGFHHPSTEEQIVALVRRARRESRQLRVRGSAHSVWRAIFTDGARGLCPGGRGIDVMLDRYGDVSFDDERMRVTVQAGCHLGVDPRDPTRMSTRRRSLLARLEARGWALPDLGGITHQTISGYLATGSAGGTLRHSLEDSVVALRLVDGTGVVREVERDRDERFDAALCSMGLLGVVSTITLQCVARYDVFIREDVTRERDCAFALLGDGDVGLEGFLRRTEYARLMWWPQRGVESVVTWQARRMIARDYDERTAPGGTFRPVPYVALGSSLREPRLVAATNVLAQAAGGLFYDALATAARAVAPIEASSALARRVIDVARDAFAAHALPTVLRAFVSAGEQREFWDAWCRGLPMDDQMSDASFPTEFTEIWVPLERTGEVMRALRAHYDAGGWRATGAYICELYGARASRAWMHPGYARDSLRVDVFWFARNPGDPSTGYFVQFWELLRPFAYRLHWGKHLPRDPALGSAHLRAHTPRWDDFLAVRRELDPDGVFFTRYWRDALGR